MLRPIAAAGALAALALPAAAAAQTVRASLADSGAAPTLAVGAPAVSADGTRVAFTSRAPLTATDPRGVTQLYVRDLETGRTLLASASAAGAAGDGSVVDDAARPAYALSADGRYVVFVSEAANLTADDNGAKRDVFRKDLETGGVELVSRGPEGTQAVESVLGEPEVSADGRRVAFSTGAAVGLFAGDPGPASDVVVRDIPAATSVVASVRADGAVAGGASAPAISADGTAVAFVTAANGVVPGDANNAADVFVRDLAASATTIASAAPGVVAAGGEGPSISGTGRYVAFETLAGIAGPADANLGRDVYVRDTVAGTTTLVSARNGLATAGDGVASGATISADATRIAFTSAATDLAGADANGAVADVYVRDVATLSTRRVSVGAAGLQVLLQRAAGPAQLSGNGRATAFLYDDSAPPIGLLPVDANGVADAFAAIEAPTDAQGPALELTSPAPGAVTDARRVGVAGRAVDPAGVAAVFVNGRRARVGADGRFTIQVPLAIGANAVVAVALDGAGNTSRAETPVARSRAAGPQVPAASRLSALTLRLARTRLVATFQLSDRARVRAELLQRVPAAEGRPRAGFQRKGRATVRNLQPGRRGLPITLPRRFAAGAYQVRVTAFSAGGVSALSTPFVVEDP